MLTALNENNNPVATAQPIAIIRFVVSYAILPVAGPTPINTTQPTIINAPNKPHLDSFYPYKA